MLLNKTIRLFLDSIGRRDEYEFYLKKFQSVDAACFALLVPDFESLDQGAEAFAFDLHFLLSLGLRPVVVLCGDDVVANAIDPMIVDIIVFTGNAVTGPIDDAFIIGVLVDNFLLGIDEGLEQERICTIATDECVIGVIVCFISINPITALLTCSLAY